MTQINLLLVEDDEEDFELFEDTLLEIPTYKFNITWAPTYKRALELIDSGSYDLFVVDYLLGAYSGLELCEQIKKDGNYLPVILLTGKGDTEIDRKASDLGVNDFLVKSTMTSTDLERSIRYSLKQSEILSALRISESKYKSVLRQSEDILFISEKSGKIMSVSNSLYNITGFRGADLSEMGIFNLIADADVRNSFLRKIAVKQNIVKQKVEIKCKNGELKTTFFTCNYQEGFTEPDFVHGVIIDKTDEIKAQKTALVYEKLESTARFMRTLAHEVRNPLSNISLAIEGMEAEEEEVSPYLSIIKRNSSRIDSIITKVLNSAQIEEKKFVSWDIVELIAKVIETIQDKAKLKGIELVVDLSAEPIMINLNEEQLSLAISNLLVNAVEAIDNNENGLIKILLDGNALVISDNGPGISKDDQSLIFEPYFTKKTNGIGLGLASSLSIFKAHKIDLDLISDLGEGATFVLKLPV
ncbi:ATP-binding response regulator [Arcticibacterium luteifluviistationis]|uniref:histidine kinase n=1 Tax=Arcticibacterium luteifluviistationis TaxID=1784714 RepID=A0A2Z4GG63_9BACT|nr:ATP-binding protein [Arcticibacterium luteifluviistationis]AWW00393.1 hypothetical protein DJ013_20325 [Arcticibacterium luteifluviistationis]